MVIYVELYIVPQSEEEESSKLELLRRRDLEINGGLHDDE
jgi:hypothetical protein